ncbi:MAG: hypothetical protein KDA60_08555, partial [Planctomycetales bacterium]|nr:hypothetical protein [Planctomycetales bacterium]
MKTVAQLRMGCLSTNSICEGAQQWQHHLMLWALNSSHLYALLSVFCFEVERHKGTALGGKTKN